MVDQFNVTAHITEVDQSSVFCRISLLPSIQLLDLRDLHHFPPPRE